jgi:hypothetical protein
MRRTALYFEDENRDAESLTDFPTIVSLYPTACVVERPRIALSAMLAAYTASTTVVLFTVLLQKTGLELPYLADQLTAISSDDLGM